MSQTVRYFGEDPMGIPVGVSRDDSTPFRWNVSKERRKLLLVGKPGTGKTNLIDVMERYCKGKHFVFGVDRVDVKELLDENDVDSHSRVVEKIEKIADSVLSGNQYNRPNGFRGVSTKTELRVVLIDNFELALNPNAGFNPRQHRRIISAVADLYQHEDAVVVVSSQDAWVEDLLGTENTIVASFSGAPYTTWEAGTDISTRVKTYLDVSRGLESIPVRPTVGEGNAPFSFPVPDCLPWYLFPLGIDGKVLPKWSCLTEPTLLVTGGVGSGKTTLVRNVVFHALQHPCWETVVLADYSDEYTVFAASSRVDIIGSSANAETRLRELVATMTERLADRTKTKKDTSELIASGQLSPILLVLDELRPGPNTEDSEYLTRSLRDIDTIIKFGHLAGIYVAGIAAEGTPATWLGAVWTNPHCRVAFDGATAGQARVTASLPGPAERMDGFRSTRETDTATVLACEKVASSRDSY